MQIIDAHCHLENEVFSDNLPDVLARARDAGVIRLVTASWLPETWDTSRTIAGQHPEVAWAVGIHPCYVEESHRDRLPELARRAKEGACAIGEIGLDRAVAEPKFELQQELFEAQLDIARSAGLPVVVHCRRAFDTLLESLKRMDKLERGGIVHAFAGSTEVARELIKLNFSISIGHLLTYRRSKKRDAMLREVYPDHMMLETDSPDLPPAGFDKPNVPANIVHNLRGASKLLGEPEERIAEATTRNAARMFGLDL